MSDHDHQMIGCPAPFFELCQECDKKLPPNREDYLCESCRFLRMFHRRKHREPINPTPRPAQFK